MKKRPLRVLLFLLLAYLIFDMVTHKGMVLFMLPFNFDIERNYNLKPGHGVKIENRNKNWTKAVNTVDQLAQGWFEGGIEIDVYFHADKQTFEVHHDPDASTGLVLDSLLAQYTKTAQKASIWLDFKNLSSHNQVAALKRLIFLRDQHKLTGKMLVESGRASLLEAFAENGFYTVYYTPYFNPYTDDEKKLKDIGKRMDSVLSSAKVQALSGYYFQTRYLQQRYPNYPILLWAGHDRWSVVTLLFQKLIAKDPSIFIRL